MELFKTMVQLQLMLFLLILTGIAVRKLKMVDEKSRKALSDLLINLILPCNIIHSFMGDMDISPEFLKNCILSLVISAAIQVAATLGSKLLFRPFAREKKSVMSYGMICSNSSFIGLPVAGAIYSDLGVLYTSIFQLPIRFTMWTAGLALFTDVDRKAAIKKVLLHPCIIAMYIGFALMLLPISLPGFVSNTIGALSSCTIPVSMIVIGAILADADIHTMFSKEILYFTLLRLVVFPLAVYAVLLPFHLDNLVTHIALIMSAMPAGSTTTILADKYGCDAMFASQIVFVSTLFSIVTTPFICLLP